MTEEETASSSAPAEIESATQDGPARLALRHRQTIIVFLGLMFGMFLASLDSSIVATALPTIAGDLGGLNEISWVVTVFLLASTITTPIYGKLGDLVGRKIIFQFAISLFVFGSVLCGFSHSIFELIVFRFVQGLGAGGLYTSVVTIIGDIVSPRERGRYQGFLVGTSTFGAVSGPLVGGFLTQEASWRWCFYVNVPVGVAALIVTSIVLNISFTRVQHAIDYLGVALITLCLGPLLLATVWGGNAYPWTSGIILALFAGGLLGGTLFIWWERRAKEPLMPLRLFAHSTFRIMNLTGFLVFAALFGTVVYLPLFLQLVTGAPPTLAGVLMMPQNIVGMCAGVFMGRRVSKSGRYKRWAVGGAISLTVGVVLLSTMTPSTPHYMTAIYMAFIGIGADVTIPVMLVAIQNGVPKEDLGTATSSNILFRQIGSSSAVAILGSVMTSRMHFWLERLLPANAIKKLGTSSVAYSPVEVRHLARNIRLAYVDAFGHSLHVVFLCAIPLAALTVPIFGLIREVPLRVGAHVTNEEVDTALAAAIVEELGESSLGATL